jgi:hypothetical protein
MSKSTAILANPLSANGFHLSLLSPRTEAPELVDVSDGAFADGLQPESSAVTASAAAILCGRTPRNVLAERQRVSANLDPSIIVTPVRNVQLS